MEPTRAAEHLQVIRTLMERSALYRRALAPIMMSVGAVGVLAAAVGFGLQISSPASFIVYWYVVGALGLSGALLLVRRQAWQQQEPFWSPPTRRVAQAMLPALTAGFVIGTVVFLGEPLRGGTARAPLPETDVLALVSLPAIWVVLYGCALHAAGFYATRGMRLFGWVLVAGGCAALGLVRSGHPLPQLGHGIMGFFFGCLHLAYGIYLYFTEPRRNEA